MAASQEGLTERPRLVCLTQCQGQGAARLLQRLHATHDDERSPLASKTDQVLRLGSLMSGHDHPVLREARRGEGQARGGDKRQCPKEAPGQNLCSSRMTRVCHTYCLCQLASVCIFGFPMLSSIAYRKGGSGPHQRVMLHPTTGTSTTMALPTCASTSCCSSCSQSPCRLPP